MGKTIPIECSYTDIWEIEKVIPNPKNPNTHPERQIELLAKIIRSTGWRNPIVISKRSGFVIKGHGRLLAAQKLGVPTVPVDLQDYESEAQEWQDMIADNRIAELAEMDQVKEQDILDELAEMGADLELCGIEESNVVIDGETDEDEIPEVVEPICKPGELWLLGRHRLLCGDSTKKKDVERLMDGERSDMVITAPP